jgi:monovalent cation:H+ antiporter, CPA1 family
MPGRLRLNREGLGRTLAWLPPYQVVLAALGIVVGFIPGLPHLHLRSDVILAIFVPPLVFEAALNLDLRALGTVVRPVALLATVGVAVTIALVGSLAHYLLGLDWPAALLLAAILSPTDPIAVVAVVRRSAAPAELAALLEGESLFNDGVGVAAFTVVLGAVAGGGHFTAAGIAADFLLLTLLGGAIGALIGLAGAAVVRRTDNVLLEVVVTTLVAYGSYIAANAIGASGVIAVVVAGVAMARGGTWGRHTERWWARLAILLNVVLFTAIGVGLPGASVVAAAGAVAGGFAILLGARLLLVYLPGLGIANRWRQLLWWGGVRGALSVALALAASERLTTGGRVPAIAYGIVAVSLLLQGTVVRPAVRLLKLHRT